MQKISKEESKLIIGGAGKGVTGALLGGIGNIIKSGFDGISTIIGDFAGYTFAFVEAGKNHVKAEYKLGKNHFKFDDSLKEKKIVEQVKQINNDTTIKMYSEHEEIIQPMISDENYINQQNIAEENLLNNFEDLSFNYEQNQQNFEDNYNVESNFYFELG